MNVRQQEHQTSVELKFLLSHVDGPTAVLILHAATTIDSF